MPTIVTTDMTQDPIRVLLIEDNPADARLIGSNREYIEHEIPHIWSLMRGSIGEVIEGAEVVVIGNGSPEFRSIEPQLRPGQIVIDLVRAFGAKTSSANGYQGICW